MKKTLRTVKFGYQQRGFALLAALMLVMIMTIVGFRIAVQGKDNAKITGSSVRYNQVFEAGELTVRKAMLFLQSIHGGEPISSKEPYLNYRNNASGTGSNAAVFQNFDVGNVSELMTSASNYAFIWDGGSLGELICGAGSTSQCPEGVDFFKYLDFYADSSSPSSVDIWDLYAIRSSFANDEGIASDGGNYLANIRTFTFVEKIEGSDVGSKGGLGSSSSEMQGSGTDAKSYYYRITVKSSGFPPGLTEAEMISENARENIILQTVFAQVY